jgi:hypothetical protein
VYIDLNIDIKIKEKPLKNIKICKRRNSIGISKLEIKIQQTIYPKMTRKINTQKKRNSKLF